MKIIERNCNLVPKIVRMLFIYNVILYIASFLLPIVGLFSSKIQLFVSGRKEVFSVLKNKIKAIKFVELNL